MITKQHKKLFKQIKKLLSISHSQSLSFSSSKFNNLYEDHYSRSIDPQQREQFWREQSQLLDWHKNPETILDKSHENPGFWRWFSDGELNISYNCIDRHVKTQPNSPAIHYYSAMAHEEITYTYKELQDQVSRFATVIRNMGVKKGDRVIIYMPQIPQALFAMLACSRLGAIHSVVFGGFASHELANRIVDSQPSLILSASCGIEPGNRIVKYKELLDAAIEESQYQGKSIIVQRDIYKTDQMVYGKDYDYEELMSSTEEQTEAVPVKGTDPHYLIYTSGSTGAPKGVLRDQGGTSVAASYAIKHIMGIGKQETYFAGSDIGWVLGHTFICYAPLLAGAATVIYEGKPVGTPDASIYWKLIEKYRIKGMFTAPTAVRAIRKDDPEAKFIKQHDITSLECMHIAGERLDINTANWIKSHLGHIPINDNYWQTETGWPITSNFLNLHWFDNLPVGTAGKPVPGYDIKIMDDENNIITEANKPGKICIKLPMPPSFMQTIWGNDKAFNEKYFIDCPGYYQVGDMGEFNEQGSLTIATRLDDVINTAGHRLSTGQLEESLLLNSEIVEAAVVGCEDELKGEIPVGFIVVKEGSQVDQKNIEKECIQQVREYIGPVAAFKHCIMVDKLPKTRSGKVLRHILQKMINEKEIDKIPATIEDEQVLEQVKKTIQVYKKAYAVA